MGSGDLPPFFPLVASPVLMKRSVLHFVFFCFCYVVSSFVLCACIESYLNFLLDRYFLNSTWKSPKISRATNLMESISSKAIGFKQKLLSKECPYSFRTAVLIKNPGAYLVPCQISNDKAFPRKRSLAGS